MNKHLINYLNSFKLKKELGVTLALDSLFLGVFLTGLIYFGNLVSRKAYLISQGKTADELKQMLLSMQSDKAAALLSSLKSFFLIFIVGLVLIVVGGLLFYSLTRKLVWDYLLKKKSRYWKWNLLNLVLITQALIYLLIYGFCRILLGTIVAVFKSQTVLDLFYVVTDLFFFLVLLLFIFLVYYSFAERYKVWESFGQAFHLIRQGWPKLWPMFLLVFGTLIIISLILGLIGRWLTGETVMLVLNIGLVLIILSWIRLYLLKLVRE